MKDSESTMETEETGWTKADLQKLLTAMKDSIPDNKKMNNYLSGLKSFDWNEVAFPPYSPEACKQKWTQMQEKMRKIRTLTELIVEAEDVIASPGWNRKVEYGEGPPPKPPQTGYMLFAKEQLMRKNKLDVCSQRWQELSDTEKEKYRTNCTKLNRQYRIKLNEYLERFDIEEQQRILRENGIKRPKKLKDELMEQQPGEPKRPSLSGNVIFCQNQMKLLKNKIPNSTQRFVEANRMWQDLTTTQKQHYQRKVDEKMEKYSTELQKWFETLTAAEQKNYLKRNPKKHQYLNAKEKEDFVNKRSLCQTSDSEDDDIEFSEEESHLYYEEDDDEEEEEDEEDAMFEM